MSYKPSETTIRSVESEFERATKKFNKFNSAHEGYAVIKEELDELWDAIKDNRKTDYENEAIQVAAMAIRFIEDICDKVECPGCGSKRASYKVMTFGNKIEVWIDCECGYDDQIKKGD